MIVFYRLSFIIIKTVDGFDVETVVLKIKVKE